MRAAASAASASRASLKFSPALHSTAGGSFSQHPGALSSTSASLKSNHAAGLSGSSAPNAANASSATAHVHRSPSDHVMAGAEAERGSHAPSSGAAPTTRRCCPG